MAPLRFMITVRCGAMDAKGVTHSPPSDNGFSTPTKFDEAIGLSGRPPSPALPPELTVPPLPETLPVGSFATAPTAPDRAMPSNPTDRRLATKILLVV